MVKGMYSYFDKGQNIFIVAYSQAHKHSRTDGSSTTWRQPVTTRGDAEFSVGGDSEVKRSTCVVLHTFSYQAWYMLVYDMHLLTAFFNDLIIKS